MINCSIHIPSTEVECVAPLCPGDQLPPPCGAHPILAVGPVLTLLYLLLVVVDVDIVILTGAQKVPEAEGDSPHTGHGNCEQSWEALLQDVLA